MSEIDYQTALLLQHRYEQEAKGVLKSESSDLELAMHLQEEFKRELDIEKPNNGLVYSSKKQKNNELNSSKCLVDPSWEVIDPTPDIHNLFMAFNQRFFWNKLLSVCVSWSKRMTTCAGICSYQGRGGLCSITLSEPLLKLRPRKDLVETLLHEMIHALLFVTHNNKDRDGHGPEFHKHMYRINAEAGTNITVYHDFHDEVRLYKQHWWKCNGPCQNWKPYFGMVKRAYNRAPGPNDRWWGEHSRNCGGAFVKVKEPEKPAKKKNNTKEKASDTKCKNNDIRNYISTTKASKSDDSTSNVSTNVHVMTNTNNSNSQIKAVMPSKSSNIYGFTNLNGGCSSKSINNSNVNSFNSTKYVSNKSGTIVINKKPTSVADNKSVTRVDNVSTIHSDDCKTNDDYSVVRNHWLNKFGNNSMYSNNKRPSSESITSPLKLAKLSNTIDVADTNISKFNEQFVSCPICDKKMSLSALDAHLDNCLDSKKDEKECIICGKNVTSNLYEKHVTCCTEENFAEDAFIDKDSKFIIEVTSDENDSIEEMKNCPVCQSLLVEKEYDRHVEKCLLNIYDDIEERLVAKKQEHSDCLACGKNILKRDLNSHLEECMSGIFDEQNEPKDENDCDKKYNCPCCMRLILEEDMNGHIDLCLNISH